MFLFDSSLNHFIIVICEIIQKILFNKLKDTGFILSAVASGIRELHAKPIMFCNMAAGRTLIEIKIQKSYTIRLINPHYADLQ